MNSFHLPCLFCTTGMFSSCDHHSCSLRNIFSPSSQVENLILVRQLPWWRSPFGNPLEDKGLCRGPQHTSLRKYCPVHAYQWNNVIDLPITESVIVCKWLLLQLSLHSKLLLLKPVEEANGSTSKKCGLTSIMLVNRWWLLQQPLA